MDEVKAEILKLKDMLEQSNGILPSRIRFIREKVDLILTLLEDG